jgi:hypothetical protein
VLHKLSSHEMTFGILCVYIYIYIYIYVYVYFICDIFKHITSRKWQDSFSHNRPQLARSKFFVVRTTAGKLGLQAGLTKLDTKKEEWVSTQFYIFHVRCIIQAYNFFFKETNKCTSVYECKYFYEVYINLYL